MPWAEGLKLCGERRFEPGLGLDTLGGVARPGSCSVLFQNLLPGLVT